MGRFDHENTLFLESHDRRNSFIKRIGEDLHKLFLLAQASSSYTSQFYLREPEADLDWVKKVTK